MNEQDDDTDTDTKLAILSSLHPNVAPDVLLDILADNDGSVEKAEQALHPARRDNKLVTATVHRQSSIAAFVTTSARTGSLTKKGKTLHLYSPDDIARHTPCSIIHNFLSAEEANDLLRELLVEAKTFSRNKFKLFDNVVESPHTAAFYVDGPKEKDVQENEYVYNGRFLKGVRQLTPRMRMASEKVKLAVNAQIRERIQTNYPGRKKLKYQSPKEWIPNAAFCNCYDGGTESVGYHADQLTYLGPRAVIGSLSLGVAREFRVRRIVPRECDQTEAGCRSDVQGQISIHLPHNSLLVMHAEMQEEWKHSIAPTRTIDPHPVSGNKRINVTYRCYRESLHPKYTPKCDCGMSTVLRCVQRSKENRGRYMWMCDVNNAPGTKGCGFFKWAEFDDDGEPPWSRNEKSVS